jgi:anti-anti-sigma regulatory factor
MSIAVDQTRASGLPNGGHICLVVSDGGQFAELAETFLAEGNARGEKTVVFGPAGSALQVRLAPLAVIAADPHRDFLGRRGLEPATMFAMFREQAALAAREGYARLRVAADMDWLLPGVPTADDVVGFEALLDRVVSELDATVLCAYRRSSFSDGTIAGALCVHPVRRGHDEEPPFEFVAGDGNAWRLSGAIDIGGADHLARALAAAVTAPCELDASKLEFIDMTGMRAIAQAARSAGVPVRVRNAPRSFRRHWHLIGYDKLAPTVHVG